jgi:hypothetical protein
MIREATGDGTAYRRILDMLAGWAMYVDGCAESYPDEKAMYEAEGDQIRALYQELGSKSGPYAELDRVAYEMLQGTITSFAVLGVAESESKES